MVRRRWSHPFFDSSRKCFCPAPGVDDGRILLTEGPHSSFDFPSYVWTAVWTLLGVGAVWVLLTRENDEPIRYKVPPAKLPEKQEILERPDIKVRFD